MSLTSCLPKRWDSSMVQSGAKAKLRQLPAGTVAGLDRTLPTTAYQRLGDILAEPEAEQDSELWSSERPRVTFPTNWNHSATRGAASRHISYGPPREHFSLQSTWVSAWLGLIRDDSPCHLRRDMEGWALSHNAGSFQASGCRDTHHSARLDCIPLLQWNGMSASDPMHLNQ